jgi:hypothetical protein
LDIEQYSQNTIGSVFDILLGAINLKNVNCDHAFSHLAKGMGLSQFIRATPILRFKKEFNLPIETFAAAGCSIQDWFDGKYDEKFTSGVYKLACDANNHFQIAKSSMQKCDAPPYRLAFLAVKKRTNEDSRQNVSRATGTLSL